MKKEERRCVHDTKYSQAVSHPSTNFAQPGLTAMIGRERCFPGGVVMNV